MNEKEQVLSLSEQGLSTRKIAAKLGISKSKAHSIIKSNQDNNIFSSLSENVSRQSDSVSKKENWTSEKPSESVSSIPKDTFSERNRTYKKRSQEEIDKENAAIQAGIDLENELKFKEHKYKGIFDINLQMLLDSKDFGIEDLKAAIRAFTEGKEVVDKLVFEVSKFTGEEEQFGFSNFLKEVLMYLRKAKIKMETFTPEELEDDSDYKFVISKELIEYEYDEELEDDDYDDDDEEQEQGEYETIVRVQLWGKYSKLKSKIEKRIEQNSLGIFDSSQNNQYYY
ncbi:helix-turn-helix domain-containing protein [Bernardetia sp.]|uniref:helix-turn-helix domain-containing protein n=1 Tax=Bernardetia sp. TaxID=1937974 RepID=UPI0025BB273D|nr:helix-turn-helix domain-containing protein [Bernardetia sp.]